MGSVGIHVLLTVLLYLLPESYGSGASLPISPRLLFPLCGNVLLAPFTVLFALARRRGWKPEHVFLLVYIPLSILFQVALPFSMVPDEATHYTRAYSIAMGQLLPHKQDTSTTLTLPANLLGGMQNGEMKLRDVAALAGLQVDESTTVEGGASGTFYYPPASYALQAAGIAAARLFTRNAAVLAYAGRLLPWAGVCILLYFSIKYIPVGKNVIIAISLMGIFLQESISLAVDGLAVAAVIAMTAFVLYQRGKPGKMTRRDYLIMASVLFMVLNFKPLYLPFLALICAIPASRYGSRKRKAWVTGGVLAGCVVLALAWAGLMLSYRGMAQSYGGALEGVDTSRQLAVILRDPLRYVMTLLRTVYRLGEFYINSLFGSALGWMNINCSYFVVGCNIVAMGWVACRESAWHSDERLTGGLLIGLSLASVLIIFTGEYLQWTKVGNDVVSGVQGRYFVPLLLPLILAAKHKKGSEAAAPGGTAVLSEPLLLSTALAVLALFNVLCVTAA
ncbi:MAG: DUF2142 domain-containing protein [Eubacteriales bacterium]|nr:DUF2142 domain-containing protein [Eubacteriales bacterium]